MTSAGLLMYRRTGGETEYLLAHPGGPYYVKKDDGCWTIPKGLVEENEDLLLAAYREFTEETGIIVDKNATLTALPQLRYKNGKYLHGWAVETHLTELPEITSNIFTVEWPPRSGKLSEFPEIDKALFFVCSEAVLKIHPVQRPWIDFMEEELNNSSF